LAKGLPVEWAALLESSAITKEEVLSKPNEVLSCLEFQASFFQEEHVMPIKEDNITLSKKNLNLLLQFDHGASITLF
jgi:hypothetical protein